MITLPTGNDAPRTGKKSADIPFLFESKARQDWDSHLNPKYNFDNYFEGTSNRLVRSSSEAIAQEPGKTFNPMFVFGASGGKTHLCHARSVTAFRRSIRKKRRCCIYQPTLPYNTRKPSGKNTTNDFMYFYQGVDAGFWTISRNRSVKIRHRIHFSIYSITCICWGKQLILTPIKLPSICREWRNV